MTDRHVEPPDPEIARLFEAESRFEPESAARQARVWEQVSSAVTPPPGGGPGGGDGGGGGLPGPGVAGALPRSLGGTFGIAAAAFVVGGLTGAGIYHLATDRGADPAEPSVVAVEPTSVAPEETKDPELPPARPVVLEAEDEPAAASPSSRTTPRRPRPGRTANEERTNTAEDVATPDAPEPSSLDRERTLIDIARQAIARGHPDEALATVARHGREFPEGALIEEREGLRVIALAKGGHGEAARRAAARFEARFPESLLLPALRTALAETASPEESGM